jgi:hypothetical protein
MRGVSAALAFAALELVGAPKAAQGEAPTSQTEEYTNEQLTVKVTTWYGWQTLLVDAAALGTGVTGFALSGGKGNVPGTIGILGYVLGAPIVHWVHGHAGKGAADAGIRLLGPLVLGGIGFLLGLPGGTNANGDPVVAQVTGAIGLGIGYAAVVTLDAAVFAFDARLVDRDPEPPPQTTVSVLPTVQLRPGGATLGLGGLF